jgi:hypothetical protein
LPADLIGRLCRADVDEEAQPRRPEGLMSAVGAAHRLIDAGATMRRQALAAEVSGACQAERGRAAAYYADAIAGIEARLATAQPDRRAALEQRLRATREEEARRLAEIAEKYEARHTIRPYRLHVMQVPALRVPADVLRGCDDTRCTSTGCCRPGPTRRRGAHAAVARRRWWLAS